MLQAIRDKAQGWIAWTIVILIIIPFALFGLDQYANLDNTKPMAQVNGQEVSSMEFERLYTRQRQMLQERLGDMYDSLVKDDDLRKRVLDSLVEQKLLETTVAELGYRVSDAQLQALIKSQAVFQENGQFSQAKYEQLLSANGLSTQGFEQLQRQAQAVTQLETAATQTIFTPSVATEQLEQVTGQERLVSHAILPLERFLAQAQVTDAQAQAEYQAHLSDYQTPEQVKIAYLQLTPEVLTQGVVPTQDALLSFYQANQNEFTQGEERRARHILFDKADKLKAEETLSKLQSGADFVALAKEFSKDPGSAAKGGDLGFFGQGMMVPEFDAAVFKLSKDQMSQLVETQFGYHIIQVTDIKPAKVMGFDQVASQVKQMYLAEKASEQYYDLSEKLANAAYEQNTSLEPAAELLGMQVKTTDWLSRDAMSDIFNAPKVREAAFSEAVYQEGLNSALIPLGTNQAMVLRVLDKKPVSQLSFEQVKARIIESLKTTQAQALIEAKAKDLLAKLQSGRSLESVAGSDGWMLTESVWTDRENFMVPPEVRDEGFKLAKANLPSYGTAMMPNGDFAIVRLEGVRAGEALSTEQKASFVKAYGDLVADYQLKALVAELKARAEIVTAP